jgi:hypothetical protein
MADGELRFLADVRRAPAGQALSLGDEFAAGE